MKRAIHLYWQATCAPAVDSVAQNLATFFPVTVDFAAVKEPPLQAFDTARGQYDADWLLRELPELDANNADKPLVLWLIKEDISCAGCDYLYGAAGNNAALVSAARTGFGENLLKEVCHEVGHLFGLEHCSDSCFMHASSNKRQLEVKPLRLCDECGSRVALQSNL